MPNNWRDDDMPGQVSEPMIPVQYRQPPIDVSRTPYRPNDYQPTMPVPAQVGEIRNGARTVMYVTATAFMILLIVHLLAFDVLAAISWSALHNR